MNLPEISRSMLKNSVILGLFAVFTVGLVAITQQGTAERIASSEREAKARALSEILPAGSYDNHLLDHPRSVQSPLLGYSQAKPAYIARLHGQISAIIFQVSAPDGYSGAIHLLVGVKADGTLAGVRVISHKETPGLGEDAADGRSQAHGGINGHGVPAIGSTKMRGRGNIRHLGHQAGPDHGQPHTESQGDGNQLQRGLAPVKQ
jgi:RnfABCDGE-type electron transport complex G subunit